MECILCGWGRIGYSDVSIHAPARGATKFQAGMFYASVVSIHAPTRGATFGPGRTVEETTGFNPRTHTGCDSTSFNQLIFLHIRLYFCEHFMA